MVFLLFHKKLPVIGDTLLDPNLSVIQGSLMFISESRFCCASLPITYYSNVSFKTVKPRVQTDEVVGT